MIREEIIKNLEEAIEKTGKDLKGSIILRKPQDKKYGDYSAILATSSNNLLDFAQEVSDNLPKNKHIEKVEVVAPGFINFYLERKVLHSILLNEPEYPQYSFGKNKKVMVEFAHPNTHKLFHIGHLRNIILGESLSRLLDRSGNTVIRTNYQGDVGLHIAKCFFGILSQGDFNKTKKKLKTTRKKVEFLGKMYALGSAEYEDNKERVLEINRMIYEQHSDIKDMWDETRQWSLDYFNEIYERLYVKYDRFYFESEVSRRGLEISNELLKSGVLTNSQNAIVFDGTDHKVDTRVFVTALGFPTYEAKELGLAELEFSEFGEIDKCIHVVAPEQASFFKTTFKVEELIDPNQYKGKQYHMMYGYVQLKNIKMSSRTGDVVEGPWVLDQARESVQKNFNVSKETAEDLAVGAVKYSMLRIDPKKNIVFDFKESISLDGNSGPYLQYTYARAKSILSQAKVGKVKDVELQERERDLLREFIYFPETIEEATRKLSPNILCNYLFGLAQLFNSFYEKYPVLKEQDADVKNLRLAIVQATAQILESGLSLLGIKPLERI